jgi:hypothetical protein
MLSLLVVGALVGMSFATAAPSAVDMVEQELAQAAQTYGGINTYIGEFVAVETHNGKIKGTEQPSAVFRKSAQAIFPLARRRAVRGAAGVLRARTRRPEHLQALEAGVAGLAGVQTLDMTSKVIDKLYPHHFRINQYHVGFILRTFARHTKRARRRARCRCSRGRSTRRKSPAAR